MTEKDMSRSSFDPKKHYSGVRMQQGRVIVDDDWNENERIESEDRRRSRVDIVGAAGSPDQGFRIFDPKITDDRIDFSIEAGSLYLGGLRLEMDPSETYRLQKDWLQQPLDLPEAPEGERYDLVYLEAWQQSVGAVEDDELVEVALGGPDTSSRVRNMRRVKIATDVGTADCGEAWARLTGDWEESNLGSLTHENERTPDTSLQVTFTELGNLEDLCKPQTAGGYLGAENQAVRVQIVDESNLTWGFDNAEPLYRVSVNETGETVTMETEPKDQAHWPLGGQTVEILPWSAVLPNGEKIAEIQGHFSKVDDSYDPDTGLLTLEDPVGEDIGKEWTYRDDNANLREDSFNYFMRVWYQGAEPAPDVTIPFEVGVPLPLGKTGLIITISGNDLSPGGYWIIAARPETPNRVVPWKLEEGLAPHGVRRFYCPLALIRWYVGAAEGLIGEIVSDCRQTFRPLVQQGICCTVTVGDGVSSFGDYNSIQEAIYNLPRDRGGKICVLPGFYRAKVAIEGRSNITITGCDRRSFIFPSLEGGDIFHISNCSYINLENMILLKPGGTAIHVENSSRVCVENNHIMACKHAIYVNQVNEGISHNIRICRNTIYMIDRVGGDVAIFLHADKSVIEKNSVTVFPAEWSVPGADTGAEGSGSDLASECVEDPDSQPIEDIDGFFQKVSNWIGEQERTQPFRAHGGIQIASGSDGIQILENQVNGGAGNGITLGSYFRVEEITEAVEEKELQKYFLTRLQSIFEISIDGNTISNMGFSGIGIPQLNLLITPYLKSFKILSAFIKTFGVLSGFVFDLSIYRNHIHSCLQNDFDSQNMYGRLLSELLKMRGEGGISLGLCENLSIYDNRIEKNGRNHIDPVCGIFASYVGHLEINHNRIHNNGSLDTAADQILRTGMRGGIVLKQVTSLSGVTKLQKHLTESDNLLEMAVKTIEAIGGYAARIHDNIIRQPVGQALSVSALGPVSVLNNRFNVDVPKFAALNKQDKLAGAVFIMNIGGPTHYLENSEKTESTFLENILQLFNGNILFSNNQTQQGLTVFNFSSQLIVTKDDLGFDNNQSDVIVAGGGDFKVNTCLLAATLRASNNRLKERIFDGERR